MPKRARSWVEADDLTGLHESGHAVAVVYKRAPLIKIVKHRWHTDFDNEAGYVQYLGYDLSPRDEAFITLAGRAAALGEHSLVWEDTTDECSARELVDAETYDAVRREVLQWTWKRDVARAINALAVDDREVLPGPVAETIITRALYDYDLTWTERTPRGYPAAAALPF